MAERCYGCGRCLPVCPYDKISEFDKSAHFSIYLSEEENCFSPCHHAFCLLLTSIFSSSMPFYVSIVVFLQIEFMEKSFVDLGAITYVRDVTATAELLDRDDVDAIEIHTSGRLALFSFRLVYSRNHPSMISTYSKYVSAILCNFGSPKFHNNKNHKQIVQWFFVALSE